MRHFESVTPEDIELLHLSLNAADRRALEDSLPKAPTVREAAAKLNTEQRAKIWERHEDKEENRAPTRPEEIDGIEINIPVGSMDPPTPEIDTIVRAMYNENNWKLPTYEYWTRDKQEADDVAYALDWHLGGHERQEHPNGDIVLTSKGYHHYIGA